MLAVFIENSIPGQSDGHCSAVAAHSFHLARNRWVVQRRSYEFTPFRHRDFTRRAISIRILSAFTFFLQILERNGPCGLSRKCWISRTLFSKCDTTYSFERIISDSNRTIQGLPVLVCESSFPYHLGEEDSAKMNIVEYYVDDSVVMTIFNHSITSELNHILLENPLDSGSTWIDVSDDTTKTTVIATKEPVSTPMEISHNRSSFKRPQDLEPCQNIL